jgi:hypothetical protein
LNLTRAQRDEIVTSYAALSAMGRLTARDLGLAVEVYNSDGDYQAARNRWFGLDAPGNSAKGGCFEVPPSTNKGGTRTGAFVRYCDFSSDRTHC